MQSNNEQKTTDSFFLRIAEEAKNNERDVNIKKNRLFISIMAEWDQAKSAFFWRQVFNTLDFKIINDLYRYIKDIINQGYPCRNPSALFVAELKNMGYYPFKKEVKNELGKSNIRDTKKDESETG